MGARPGQWQPVEADAIYRGVSSAYTASGKEGYTALARTLTQHNQELGITLADAFIRWARYLPELAAAPALVEYQGRLPDDDLAGHLAVARQVVLAGFVRKRAAFMP